MKSGDVHTRSTLAEDYRKMGLQKGDVVLVRAALKAIGRIDFDNDAMPHVNAILDVIGKEGTLVGLSFSKYYTTPLLPPSDAVFTRHSPAITGGLANLMLAHPDAVRSLHPTNSFVAIGDKAEEILAGHDHTTHTYYPMEKILELNGKMMLVGCIDSSPGFTTAHLAEYKLGLLNRILFTWLHKIFYLENGQRKLFKRKEVGGDSSTFFRFYPHYKAAGKLVSGMIGDAQSLLISARDAYAIEYDILQKNPRFCICDDVDCQLCKGRCLYNKRGMPLFYFRLLFYRAPVFIFKKLARLIKP